MTVESAPTPAAPRRSRRQQQERQPTAYSVLRRQADAVWEKVIKPDRPLLLVQHGTSSLASGAEETLAALREEISRRGLAVDVDITGCNGLDYAEPIVHVIKPDGTRILYGNLTAERVPEFLTAVIEQNGYAPHLTLAQMAGRRVRGISALTDLPVMKPQVRRLMARVGLINPENIDHYIATGGYEGLNRVFERNLSPEEVIKEVLDSGLWGRGGAAFPTGRKWDFLRTARGDLKYLICNADEGDAGSWVNRVLMEGDPHGILEGMLIAAVATGAQRSVIYIRDEYPLAIKRMQQALDQMRERGLLGEHILGSNLSHDIVIVRGAGSYVCGEETGLIASAEGDRGMPKIRPPYPAQSGLFGKPTNVNNVETYANVPLILRHGAQWYRQVGTERNAGTKMFTVSGHIQRVACLEVPLGTPTSVVINEACGGVPEGRTLKAVQPGGALGGLYPAQFVDMTLEPESYREKGVLMGSGGLVVLDDTACIIDMCIYFSWFAEDESCGRCTTCHGGTQRMTEILRRIARGGGRESDFDHLRLLGDTMRWANCVHGQAAPTAILNSLQYFMDEYVEHVFNKRCPVQVCKALIRYEVTAQGEKLTEAAALCPTDAIVQRDGAWVIDQERCIKCSACFQMAPGLIRQVDAVSVREPVMSSS